MARFAESLASSPFSAVIARVSYQTIVLDYRKHPDRYVNPADGIQDLRVEMSAAGWESIACWLTAYAFAVGCRGMRAVQARDWVVDRAMQAEANRRRGTPWRRVPSASPPVSNTGARPSKADGTVSQRRRGTQ